MDLVFPFVQCPLLKPLLISAAWRLGLPAANLFTSADLYKKKSITAVYRCLYALQVLAPSLGYKGAVIDDALFRAAGKDVPKAKSWNSVETKPKKVRIDEVRAVVSRGISLTIPESILFF